MVNKSIYKEESNRMVENVPNEDLHDMCSSPVRDEMGEHGRKRYMNRLFF
jgi:hypothetical protein